MLTRTGVTGRPPCRLDERPRSSRGAERKLYSLLAFLSRFQTRRSRASSPSDEDTPPTKADAMSHGTLSPTCTCISHEPVDGSSCRLVRASHVGASALVGLRSGAARPLTSSTPPPFGQALLARRQASASAADAWRSPRVPPHLHPAAAPQRTASSSISFPPVHTRVALALALVLCGVQSTWY
jgi:hypothetical protein